MKLLTWNILHQDFSTKKFPVDRLEKIFTQIKGYNPDIICLQEVDHSELGIYLDSFDEEYDLFWQDDKNRRKRLNKWLSFGGDKPNTIICLTMTRKKMFSPINHKVGSRSLTVEVKTGDLAFTITNVHLESGRNVNEIHLKHLSKLMNSDILCGDFNDFLGEPSLDYVSDNDYLSVFSKHRPAYTFKDGDTEMLIDFIFHKPKFRHSSVKWGNEFLLSDHCPIIATLF